MGGERPLNISDTSPQSATQAQLTLPSWHPGEDLTRLEEEMKDKAAAGGPVSYTHLTLPTN